MTGVPSGTIPAAAALPASTALVGVSTSTMTLQPDQTAQSVEVSGSEDVLWLIGGGMLALLALGFILTRRSRQRTSESVLDPDRSDQRDDEFVEPLL
ncbi:hypothetical protein ACFL6R_02345 [Gemmatimonadota bacterium]